MSAPPVDLPVTLSQARDNYRAVIASGTPTGQEIHVLDSGTAAGTGYRVVSKFVLTDGRSVLLDQGLLPLDDKAMAPQTRAMQVIGNVLWPDDVNASTPDPDLSKNIWFGRDVITMSAHLDTMPLMIVMRDSNRPDPRLTPLPVDTLNIKNDHLEYALTWFGLALVWAIMTLFLIFRTLRQKDT
jgi:surfeit locus 1 family protein